MKHEMIELVITTLNILEFIERISFDDLKEFYGKYQDITYKTRKYHIVDFIKENFNNDVFKEDAIDFLKDKPILIGSHVEDYLNMTATNRKWLQKNGVLNVSKEKPVRMYGSTVMVPKFSILDIINCQFDERFRNYMLKAYERSQRTKKASETRKENLVIALQEKIDNLEVHVELLDKDELYNKAMESKIQWLKRPVDYYNHERNHIVSAESYVQNADLETKNRWIDNYIRHHLTNYDGILDDLDVEMKRHFLYYDILAKVEAKIEEVYPNYIGKF